MALFGSGKAGEMDALMRRVQASEARRKELVAELTNERRRIAELETALAKATTELTGAKVATAAARKRQKASVERANRFKSRLEASSSPANG